MKTCWDHLGLLRSPRNISNDPNPVFKIVNQQLYAAQQAAQFGASGYAGGYNVNNYGQVDESAKQRYIEEEKERLRMYEEQRRKQIQTQPQAQQQPSKD